MGLIELDHYSFSRLNQVSECPYAMYLEKIEGVEQEQNAFSQNGQLVHNILDTWAKGNLDGSLLGFEYEERYPNEVTARWPKMFGNDLGKSTYTKILDYFNNFPGFDGYEIIDSEHKFETDIDGRTFVGIIDMILRDKETGEYAILDHKSKSISAFRKAQDHMYLQPLLYSKHFYEQYGFFPKKLMFNLFKEGGRIMSRDFNIDDYNAALDWAREQIRKIETYDIVDWFETKPSSDIFCQHICSYRFQCPNGYGSQT